MCQNVQELGHFLTSMFCTSSPHPSGLQTTSSENEDTDAPQRLLRCCWSIAKSCRDGSGRFAAGWRKNSNWKGGVEIISIHCYLFNLHCSLFLPPPPHFLLHSIFQWSTTSTKIRRFTSFKSLLFYANSNSDNTY